MKQVERIGIDELAKMAAAMYGDLLKAVLQAREEFLRLFFDGTFEEDADNIERYFNQFAVAARP